MPNIADEADRGVVPPKGELSRYPNSTSRWKRAHCLTVEGPMYGRCFPLESSILALRTPRPTSGTQQWPAHYPLLLQEVENEGAHFPCGVSPILLSFPDSSFVDRHHLWTVEQQFSTLKQAE